MTRALLVALLLAEASCTSGTRTANSASQLCASPPVSASIPFRFIGKHIFADAVLDGQRPFPVVIDTGGVNLISPEIQARLRLRIAGNEEGHGVGAAAVQSGKVIVPTTQLGDATLRKQLYYVYPLDAISASGGVPFQGMIGNQAFRGFVMRIDYGAHVIRLIKRSLFDPKCSGTAIPLTFENNQLFATGSFDGMPGRFRVDTGSGAMLDIDTPFVRAHHLLSRFPHRVAASTSGVGGSIGTYLVRADHLDLGTVHVAHPIVGLTMASGGNFALSDVAGNVGNGILARFVVTIDFAGRTLYLTPSATIPQGLDDIDRSGLLLQWSKPNFRVSGIEAPSPAASAGIRSGDLITAVNEIPARMLTLLDVRTMLSQDPVGTPITLSIQRDASHRNVTLRLRNLL